MNLYIYMKSEFAPPATLPTCPSPFTFPLQTCVKARGIEIHKVDQSFKMSTLQWSNISHPKAFLNPWFSFSYSGICTLRTKGTNSLIGSVRHSFGQRAHLRWWFFGSSGDVWSCWLRCLENTKVRTWGWTFFPKSYLEQMFLAHHWVQIKGSLYNVQSFTRTKELLLGSFQCILVHFMLGFLDVFFGVTERAKEMQMIVRRCWVVL